MSCYNWESGTIKLPAREWASFKKGLRETWNRHRANVLAKAEKLQPKLADEFKGKRNVKGHEVHDYVYRIVGCDFEAGEEEEDAVAELLLASLKDGSAWQTKKITQAMIDRTLGPKATTKTHYYGCCGVEASITLNNEQRSVTWSVPENNHAVEDARATKMGEALFEALDKVDFGKQKGVGGIIKGNDEYNRDEGGCGDYVVKSYGVKGNGIAQRFY